MSVESHPGLLWCCINSLYDWSKTPAPPSQTIRFKTEGNHDLVTRVFPRFGQFACFYFEPVLIGSLWHCPLLWLAVLNALVLLWGSLSKCAPTEDSITYDIRGYKRKRKQVSRKVMLLTADRVATSASKTSLTFIALARRLFRSFLVFSFFLRGSWSVYYFISKNKSTKGKIISICKGQLLRDDLLSIERLTIFSPSGA